MVESLIDLFTEAGGAAPLILILFSKAIEESSFPGKSSFSLAASSNFLGIFFSLKFLFNSGGLLPFIKFKKYDFLNFLEELQLQQYETSKSFAFLSYSNFFIVGKRILHVGQTI